MRSPKGPRPGGAPQIVDVARLAGVSPATVSRAMTNPGIVSAKTRERVLAAVLQAGYTPNIAGRNLRARRSFIVLVVVPDITNVFFAEVLRGIDQTLSDAGYAMIVGNLDNSRAKEARFVDLVFAGQVDGALLLNGRILADGQRSIDASGVPLVGACEHISGVEIAQVDVDNRAAAKNAILYLASLGHTQFGYVSGPATNVLEHERAAGFREGLRASGIKPESAIIFPGDFTFKAGVAAARKMLERPKRPTAIFAANDEMAIGFLKAVLAAGLTVPGAISIIGFDGIDYADYCEPTLTTVRQPRYAIGAAAATRLIAEMQGNRDPAGPALRLETTLELRGSAARCNK